MHQQGAIKRHTFDNTDNSMSAKTSGLGKIRQGGKRDDNTLAGNKV